MADTLATVTAHVWRIAPRHVPAALASAAWDPTRLRRLPGVRFVKLLGTSRDFSIRRADPTRWMLIMSWNGPRSSLTRSPLTLLPLTLRRYATECWSATLVPVSSRGRWSRRDPFAVPAIDAQAAAPRGPVIALTRARVRAPELIRFWRDVPPVALAAASSAGLRVGFGVGEAPLGVQGTFSVWDDDEALHDFAYRDEAHRRVVAQARGRRWYAEELFARFRVAASSGTIDGADPAAA